MPPFASAHLSTGTAACRRTLTTMKAEAKLADASTTIKMDGLQRHSGIPSKAKRADASTNNEKDGLHASFWNTKQSEAS